MQMISSSWLKVKQIENAGIVDMVATFELGLSYQPNFMKYI